MIKINIHNSLKRDIIQDLLCQEVILPNRVSPIRLRFNLLDLKLKEIFQQLSVMGVVHHQHLAEVAPKVMGEADNKITVEEDFQE